MAIIRKGDAEAEAGLKARAKEQRENRRNASDNEKERAGLVKGNVYINPKTKKSHTLDLGNPVTGNAYALNRVQFSGPVSGSSIAKKQRNKTRNIILIFFIFFMMLLITNFLFHFLQFQNHESFHQ